ncbi:MAG TPA: polyphosphate polymerase domain-containing protein [Candidatus Hydrogenedentes bacterium]|nr:polyphosphate polymerase domain-containing protein [Candidatus Hydrogenedentota bacterium]
MDVMVSSHIAATTAQRFEAKYFLSEVHACAITEFIQPFVRPDEHARVYVVGTTYLDAADLRLYRGSVCGEKNRFKLRVRSYRSNGNGHVFLEIKRRLDQIIRKERVSVPTAEADQYLLATPLPAGAEPWEEGKGILALHNFNALRECLMAIPRIDITYTREAYMSGFGDPVRITFDRNIQCLPVSSYAEVRQQDGSVQVPVITKGVVLEIKFTNRYPQWVHQIVQRFNLQRQSVSKYVLSVDALKRQGLPISQCPGGFCS